jgi:hypothetical protein
VTNWNYRKSFGDRHPRMLVWARGIAVVAAIAVIAMLAVMAYMA